MSRETLYLIDGTSLCYRSFFAIKLSTKEGVPTGAVYGVHQTLNKIISKYKVTYMGVCFDVSRKTFRQEKFKEYKIQRPPLPEGLKMQFSPVKQIIEALGVKNIEKRNFEADDVIASLCQKAVADGLKVVIVTSDKDLYQLIDNEQVMVYNYVKDKMVNRDNFISEWGFPPEFMVDYLSLAGDATDNVPGAKGIGKVGAAKLVKEFGTLDNIFDNLDKIPSRTKEMLNNDKENILLSKELVTLCCCDLDVSWKDLKIKEQNNQELYKMFKELEFKNLLKSVPAPQLNLDIKVVNGASGSALKKVANDCLSFTIRGEEIFIFDHQKEIMYKDSINNAKTILEDGKIKKISYSVKEQILCSDSVNFQGIFFDVKIASYLLDSSLSDYSLSSLVSHFLDRHTVDIPAHYEAYFIYELYCHLSSELKKEGLWELFEKVEMPLLSVLAQMQKDGVKININILNELFAEVDKRISSVKNDVIKQAGENFNLNSPKQLSIILFEKLKIKPIKKTKTGYSTNEEVLEKLSLEYPIAESVLEYRYLNKIKTTYLSPLIEEVKKHNGYLHTHFHQTIAQTGRLSSSSPNLQNIPVKGELSSRLREAFVPSSVGGCFLAGDYSQIELRILAHLSKDEKLIDAFNQKRDIHSFTASLLFGAKEEEITNSQRNTAKRVNFGIVYGMGAYGLSRELKIPVQQSQSFIDDYFKRYPGIKDYVSLMKEQAESKGYVETILGRRRILPDIKNVNLQLREFAYRQAVNAPIQGSSADIIKIAMVKIADKIKERALKTKLIIQIHDELVFDVYPDELAEVSEFVKQYMENAIKLIVPVEVNLKTGKNWSQMVLFEQ